MKGIKLFQAILSGAIVVILIFVTCSKDNPVEPKKDTSFVGNWDIYSTTWNTPNGTGTYNKTQLDSLGVIWKIKFKTDGTAEQITNVDGELMTMPGTWTSSGKKLYTTWTTPNGIKGTLNYDFAVKNNLLSLSWTYAGGVNRMTAVYVRVEE